MRWDVFLSHAWEDKEFARSLAQELEHRGFRVWFDEFELHTGDSLRGSIDTGLAKSKFGVVILSIAFFAKEWTQKELGALTARESFGKKVVLPVWHNITADQIRKYSPMLADRFAITSQVGVISVANELVKAINPPKKNKQDQPFLLVSSQDHIKAKIIILDKNNHEIRRMFAAVNAKATSADLIKAMKDALPDLFSEINYQVLVDFDGMFHGDLQKNGLTLFLKPSENGYNLTLE